MSEIKVNTPTFLISLGSGCFFREAVHYFAKNKHYCRCAYDNYIGKPAFSFSFNHTP